MAARFPITVVVEIGIIGAVPVDQIATLQTEVDKVAGDLSDRLESLGLVSPHKVVSRARPASKDEILAFVPRKMHYTLVDRSPQKQVCTTAYVSQKNLTTDVALVTCKLCRQQLENGLL